MEMGLPSGGALFLPIDAASLPQLITARNLLLEESP